MTTLQIREYQSGRALCLCGCGEPAPRARQNLRHVAKGQAFDYCAGHHRRAQQAALPDFVEDSETNCWVWQKGLSPKGYGQAWIAGTKTTRNAHRVYYEDLVGSVDPGLELDHLCGNRACVNPAHLEPVTHVENVRRGRRAKLTAAAVAEIRSSPRTGRELARQFGVTESAISAVRKGRVWRQP